MDFKKITSWLFFTLCLLVGITVLYTAMKADIRTIFKKVKEPLAETPVAASGIEPAASYQIIVKKAARKLHLYNDKGKLLKTYQIALGPNPIGTKLKQGDGATPEGEYYLTHKNPKSNYYLSLGVSYPNSKDAQSGLQRKLITQAQHDAIVAAINTQAKPLQNTKLGGDIFIHGGGNRSDWTLGCVALENPDIKELFDLLPIKTPIKIEP